MGYPLREEIEGAYYHVGTRGNNQRDIYTNESSRLLFCLMLQRLAKEYSWRIHAYCLMNNHYHLVLRLGRGYCSEPLRDEIRARGITPQISKRRRPGDPLAPGQTQRPGTRGRKRVTRTSDPNARHRWVVERTNAWLRRFRRLTIRTEPNSNVYLAYLTIALILILGRAL